VSQDTVPAVPPLAMQCQEHKPTQTKQAAYSAACFARAASSSQAGPPPPHRRPSRQLKTSARKEKEKGAVETKARFSARGATHTSGRGHGVWGTVLASCCASSGRSRLPWPRSTFRGPTTIKKEGAGAGAPVPSAPAAWTRFWPTLPAGDLRSPHLLPAATWGRFLIKISLPVASRNLNPFQRLFFWGSPLVCFFFFTIKQRYFSDV